MWGNETEVLDGTQLAADYTFSGLQKFGQGLEERLRGLKMKSKLLEKVIPTALLQIDFVRGACTQLLSALTCLSNSFWHASSSIGKLF